MLLDDTISQVIGLSPVSVDAVVDVLVWTEQDMKIYTGSLEVDLSIE